MDIALKLPELLELIFVNCLRLDLNALARTSKDFLEPALDELWKHSDVFTLLEVLPRDKWEYSVKVYEEREPRILGAILSRSREHEVFTLSQPLTSKDAERFAFYSKHVQKIWLNHSSKNIGEMVLDHLMNGSTPGHIFPRLRDISVYNMSIIGPAHEVCAEICSLLHATLSIQTTDLTICLPSLVPSVTEGTALFGQLGGLCPNIVSLKISYRYSYAGSDISAALASSISQMSHLEVVDICPLNGEIIRHLACLPAVSSITYDQQANEPAETTPWTTTSNFHPFPSLMKLKFSGSVALCSSLVMALTTELPLHQLLIDWITPPEKELLLSFNDFFLHVVTHFPSLRTLSITRRHRSPADWKFNAPLIQPKELFQLAPLSQLRHLLLHKIIPDDETMRFISEAFPMLERLQLNAPHHSSPSITVHGLCGLARCSSLRYAMVDYIDMSSIPSSENLGKEGHIDELNGRFPSPNLTLQILGRGGPIEDPVRVASILRQLFPNLCQIVPAFPDSDYSRFEELWREVAKNLTTGRNEVAS